MEKESKQKKSETNALKEVSYCPGTLHTVIEDGFKQSKEVKRQKKKIEISTVELDGFHNVHKGKRQYEKADDYDRKREKKEKKRKLEPLEDSCKSGKEVYMVGEDLGNGNEFRRQKKRHKEGSKKDKNESLPFQEESLKDKESNNNEELKEERSSQHGNIAQIKNGTEQIENKKNAEGRRDKEVGDFKGKKKTMPVEQVGKVGENYDVDVIEKVEKKKKKKKKKRKKEGEEDLGGGVLELMAEGKKKTVGVEKVGEVGENHNVDVSEKKEKKRKKGKKEGIDDLGGGVRDMISEELGMESTMIQDRDLGDNKDKAHSTRKKAKEKESKNGEKGKRKKPKSVETFPKDPVPQVNAKKVRFSGVVEVFPLSDGPSKRKERNQEEGLVQGKRFTPEEDERIKEAVFNYIQAHNLGEEGLHMVLHCKSFPQVKNCWKEIGNAFHNRPYTAVYYRAHILFERDEKRTWTEEEVELVRSHHAKHGPKWKELAEALGKHRIHLKDTWRRIKFPNRKLGHWSQDEYQGLFDLVNKDLQLRVFEEKKTKYGMLRDNIKWTAISEKLSTRADAVCCMKWYSQLTSPMVAEGIWADADDYHMLDALFSLDESCMEDVDWDNLLEHRSGEICRRRWNQMVSHIGEHVNKSFAEQVEVLSKRYCPDLIEAREAWDSKPVVD